MLSMEISDLEVLDLPRALIVAIIVGVVGMAVTSGHVMTWQVVI